MHGTASGLAHLHAQRICHLDLKTENILLGRPQHASSSAAASTASGHCWTPKLADLGLALRPHAATGTIDLGAGNYRGTWG
ncbi:hypothetical protein WJX84_010794 [Apatococcus fuscideae]|uniref:Protein kinase domain-containing protein n=1 Tax=Apatococcus fuscideae TaxID=2026836 RepID=A0AAW1S2A8_9CHLO